MCHQYNLCRFLEVVGKAIRQASVDNITLPIKIENMKCYQYLKRKKEKEKNSITGKF